MRKSGILLPLSSLPSASGIGTLGRPARDFIDFLEKAGQSLWQILPIGPTGFGDSPYQSFSAFAANPYYIDLELLQEEQLLEKEEYASVSWSETSALVDYSFLFENRTKVLQKAVDRFPSDHPDYLRFVEDNIDWLDNFSLFMALKEENQFISFQLWEEPYRLRDPQTLLTAEERLSGRVYFWKVVQFFFFRQWASLRDYAHQKGIQLIGDIPIYVSPDSSDLWANPELFITDQDRRLLFVSGCPPDSYAENGQLWGNPLYDWDMHKKGGYNWWIRRLIFSSQLFDAVRIDHFRGFSEYYSIPSKDHTAKNGHWEKGPGMDFISAIKGMLPNLNIIAEDLGFLTEDVKALLRESGFPGMKVLQFAFAPDGDGAYLPHNHIENAVVYTGTHDNDTMARWEYTEPYENVSYAREYLSIPKEENLTSGFIRAALSSVCETCVIPLQDYLHLGSEARINTPGTLLGNWRWRVNEDMLTEDFAKEIHYLTRLYRRF